MSELLIVKPLEAPTPHAVTVTQPAPTRLQKVRDYFVANRGYFAALVVMFLFVAANAAGAQVEDPPPPGPPPELGNWIMQGLYDGMDIIWGMSAIVIVLMIPAGLQFAVGILKGVVGSFSGFRF